MKKILLLGLLIVGGVILGWVANQILAQPPGPAPRLFSIHAEEVKVRGPGETQVTDKTKKVLVEIFEDRVGRQNLYIARPDGGVAVAPWRKTAQVRQILTSGGVQVAIRFNVNSGESWLLDGGKWKTLAEANAIPGGDYDLHLMPADKGDRFFALRIDHLTGKTWSLLDRKWEEVQEK